MRKSTLIIIWFLALALVMSYCLLSLAINTMHMQVSLIAYVLYVCMVLANVCVYIYPAWVATHREEFDN